MRRRVRDTEDEQQEEEEEEEENQCLAQRISGAKW
jgi:hypothetical protein